MYVFFSQEFSFFFVLYWQANSEALIQGRKKWCRKRSSTLLCLFLAQKHFAHIAIKKNPNPSWLLETIVKVTKSFCKFLCSSNTLGWNKESNSLLELEK